MSILTKICCHHSARLVCAVSRQDIRGLTIWRLQEDTHTFIVHLSGPIHHLETEMEGCGALHEPPMPGEVTVVPAGCRYETLARGGLITYAEIQVAPRLLSQSPHISNELRARAGHFDPRLYALVQELTSSTREEGHHSSLAGDEITVRMQEHLIKTFGISSSQETSGRPPAKVQLSSRQIRLLREAIREQLSQKLTLDALSSLVSVTPHHLLIGFRQAFGTTPAQYILECRLRRARWLLRTTKEDLLTIALLTGFNSHSHLTNAFTKRCAMTPSAFRELILA